MDATIIQFIPTTGVDNRDTYWLNVLIYYTKGNTVIQI